MEPKDLRDGVVYRLTREVKNPTPDRRKTRDWTASPAWKEGITVLCTDRGYLALQARGEYDRLTNTHDGFEAFVAALEPAPRTFATVMFAIDSSPRGSFLPLRLLGELVRMGKITLDDIEAAKVAWYARPDDE